MEKLIELLNEYENTDNWENWQQVEFRESKIISKKFWFIEWLVENEKLTTDFAVKESWSNAITMLLAVAPNPISFLISLLK